MQAISYRLLDRNLRIDVGQSFNDGSLLFYRRYHDRQLIKHRGVQRWYRAGESLTQKISLHWRMSQI